MRRLRSPVLLLPVAILAGALLGGCSPSHPPAGHGAGPRVPEASAPALAPERAARKCGDSRILLIGLDAADGALLDSLISRGELPNLARFRAEGATGPLASMKPMLSPILWTTIATGRPPDEHGILDFLSSLPGPPRPTLSGERRTDAIWNILSRAGCRVGVVGWYATWPAEEVNGFIVSDRAVPHSFHGGEQVPADPAGKTWPSGLLQRIEPLLVAPESIPHLELKRVFALGPVPGDREDKLRELRAILAQTRSYASVARMLLTEENLDFLGVYFEGLDSVSHLFIEYAPPALRGVSREDEAAFGGAIEGLYREMDSILGKLLEAAGPDRVVILASDHGFLWGPDRLEGREGTSLRESDDAPRWHRDPGILWLRGPGIASGVRFDGAGLLDIVPTLLALEGLPSARDLRGHVIDGALTEETRARLPGPPVASYEVPWRSGRPGSVPPVSAEDREEIERLRALGYVGGGEGQAGSGSARAASNLGVYYLAQGRNPEALRQFQEAIRLNPADYQALLNLGITWKKMGQIPRGEEPLRKASELRKSDPVPLWLLTECAYARGDYAEALRLAEEALRRAPERAESWLHRGSVLGRLGRLEEAERDLRRALEIDPRNEEADRKLQEALRRRTGDERR